MAFCGIGAEQDPDRAAASGYETDTLAARGLSTFIQLVWQLVPDPGDTTTLLPLVIDDSVGCTYRQSRGPHNCINKRDGDSLDNAYHRNGAVRSGRGVDV